MNTLWLLTFKSIFNRRTAFLLSLLSIALSVILLLGIERSVQSAKSHFLNTISKTDLIIASPGGSLEILLNLVRSQVLDSILQQVGEYLLHPR